MGAEVIDTLMNMFLPDRRALWNEALAQVGVSSRLAGDQDGFATLDEVVARMDALAIATALIPTCDLGRHGTSNPHAFERLAARWEEMEEITTRHPGRFLALAVIDPSTGSQGIRAMRAQLDRPWVAGCYLHTHSWDRRFDHADYYPYYTLAAEVGVPVAMQAGISGGPMASECGHPIGIDRPALYFQDTAFILSHTGWPWVQEATAMALKHSNVYLGTGSYPPRHWDAAILPFLRGPGRHKVLFATNSPTVGHRRALEQIADLDLDHEVRGALCAGTARHVYARIP